jgi:hypothetical protein
MRQLPTFLGRSHHDLNMLPLCDCFRKCYVDHLRYRRHLYLDRNQSYEETELNRTSRFIAKLDWPVASPWAASVPRVALFRTEGGAVSRTAYIAEAAFE